MIRNSVDKRYHIIAERFPRGHYSYIPNASFVMYHRARDNESSKDQSNVKFGNPFT